MAFFMRQVMFKLSLLSSIWGRLSFFSVCLPYGCDDDIPIQIRVGLPIRVAYHITSYMIKFEQ